MASQTCMYTTQGEFKCCPNDTMNCFSDNPGMVKQNDSPKLFGSNTQVFDESIEKFSNSSRPRIVDETYQDTFYNSSRPRVVDETYQDTFYNSSRPRVVDETTGDTFTNKAPNYMIREHFDTGPVGLTSTYVSTCQNV